MAPPLRIPLPDSRDYNTHTHTSTLYTFSPPVSNQYVPHNFLCPLPSSTLLGGSLSLSFSCLRPFTLLCLLSFLVGVTFPSPSDSLLPIVCPFAPPRSSCFSFFALVCLHQKDRLHRLDSKRTAFHGLPAWEVARFLISRARLWSRSTVSQLDSVGATRARTPGLRHFDGVGKANQLNGPDSEESVPAP